MNASRVLVVGAGIAGLALARALSQRGIITEVVERATAWQPSGTGLYLPANAVRALHELGIGSAATAHANPIGRQRLLNHRGRLLADIDLDRIWDGVGGCVAIRRAALHEALRQATAEVPVRLGTSVTDLEIGGARRG
jgi:2-polyprenyl-6-methoxyphenol hydroxylase-like FAD-dependent oxidoreductase